MARPPPLRVGEGGVIRILICGSRGWKDPRPIEAVITHCDASAKAGHDVLTVIHGDAPQGADHIADNIARRCRVAVIREPADWKRYGRGAGPVRNQKMLDDHKPDEVYAFRTYGKSNGTDDMCARARAAGVPTFILTREPQ